MKPALLVIAQKGYQDVELKGTRDALVKAGFPIVLASKEKGECTGKFDGKETATVSMRDVDVMEYSRVGFIGGPGMGAYADDGDAQYIAQSAIMYQVPLGAICIAPLILARAGVLEGYPATVWNEDGKPGAELAERGVRFTAEPVTVVPGKLIVTANGPEAATAFGEALATL